MIACAACGTAGHSTRVKFYRYVEGEPFSLVDVDGCVREVFYVDPCAVDAVRSAVTKGDDVVHVATQVLFDSGIETSNVRLVFRWLGGVPWLEISVNRARGHWRTLGRASPCIIDFDDCQRDHDKRCVCERLSNGRHGTPL